MKKMKQNVLPNIQIIEQMPKKQDRFSKIGEPSAQFTTEEQNIILQRSVLLKDNGTGSVYLQLKFYNLGNVTIQSAYLKLIFFNDAGDVLNDGKETSVEYSNINCEVGKDFGAKTLIPTPPTVVKIKALDIKVVLNNGTVKNYVGDQIIHLPDAKPLKNVLPERYHSYIETDKQLNYQPEQISKYLYRCACGGLINGGGKCPICGKTYQEALVSASEETVRVNQESYFAEVARKQQLEEEQKKRLAKQSKSEKIYGIIFIICALMSGISIPGLIHIALAVLMLSGKWKQYGDIICKWWFVFPALGLIISIVLIIELGTLLAIIASIIGAILYTILFYKLKIFVQTATRDYAASNYDNSISGTAINESRRS